MTTNKQPWSAILNVSQLTRNGERKNELKVVRSNSHSSVSPTQAALVVASKRYSFDDNGGGYMGL